MYNKLSFQSENLTSKNQAVFLKKKKLCVGFVLLFLILFYFNFILFLKFKG